MELDEMVEVDQTQKIQCLFINLLKIKNRILLWQNCSEVKRVMKHVQFRKYDASKSELIFWPKDGLFSFDAKKPVYFYSYKRTTIFKNMIYFNSNYNLVIKTPGLILLKNIRKDDRQNVEGQLVSFMFGEDNIGRGSWFKAKMIDRSQGGFSFISSLSNIIKFKPGQKLEFQFSGMDGYRKGEIVNVGIFLDQNNKKLKRVSVKMLK